MATAPDPTPTKKLEELLRCSICQETLKEPRTLGCFHSFCKHCLARYVEIQRGEEPMDGARDLFQCPLCRTHFELRQGESVEQLPTIHFINNMLDILVMQKQAQKLPCNSCNDQLPAVCRCVDCENYLCNNCFKTHSNWPAFKDHDVLTLEELTKPENQAKAKGKPRCKKYGHENKPFTFYCNTCQELACINCSFSDHPKSDHKCQPVKDVAKQHKEALEHTSTNLLKQSEQGQNALKKIERAFQVAKDSAKKAKDAILQQEREVLKEVTAKLKLQTAALLDEVDKKYNYVNQKLVKQQSEVHGYVEKVNGSLGFAQNIIEKGSDEEIISLGGEIEKSSNTTKKECPKLMYPVHSGHFEYLPARSTKGILESVNFNDLGRIGNRGARLLCETSTILEGNISHAEQLACWLDDGNFLWKQCYRASQDGWGADDFHRKCDEVGATVTLVKCGTNIFGGYTDRSWNDPRTDIFGKVFYFYGFRDCFKHSNASFLFSLQNKESLPPFKCPIYDGSIDRAIFCDSSRGADFGCGDLFISDNANINQDSRSNLGRTYQPPPGYQPRTPLTRSLLAGSEYFQPTEIEVFHR